MAHSISPAAVVDSRAEIDDDVEIGPFCTVGPEVVIGRGTRLESHVSLQGRLTIGQFNHFHPGAVIGGQPQDLSYRGGDTRVAIGDHNVFRESVTVNCGSHKERGVTEIGNHCFLMAYSHVAHDCVLGDRVVLANSVMLSGHVHVNDDATVSGGAGVHQFATVGSYSFVGGLSRVLHDVPPFMLVEGAPARPRCINVVALKRNDFAPDDIKALSEAHRLIYRSKVGLDHAREILRSNSLLTPSVNHLLNFVQNQQEGRHGRWRESLRRAA